MDEADPAPQQFAQGPKVTVYDLPSLQPAYRSFSREQGGEMLRLCYLLLRTPVAATPLAPR